MPTDLGELKTNEPAPTAKVQIKRGRDGTAMELSNLVPVGTKYSDGVGGVMEISYTPKYECRWIVKASGMPIGIDAGGRWDRLDFMINCSPNDMDGRYNGDQVCMQTYLYTSVQWRTYTGYASFRLAPGITYTASIQHAYSSGYRQQIHTGHIWSRIVGHVIGEGEVVP